MKLGLHYIVYGMAANDDCRLIREGSTIWNLLRGEKAFYPTTLNFERERLVSLKLDSPVLVSESSFEDVEHLLTCISGEWSLAQFWVDGTGRWTCLIERDLDDSKHEDGAVTARQLAPIIDEALGLMDRVFVAVNSLIYTATTPIEAIESLVQGIH